MAMAMATAPGWECKPIRAGRKRLASPREGGGRETTGNEVSRRTTSVDSCMSLGRTDPSTIRRFGSVVDGVVECFRPG